MNITLITHLKDSQTIDQSAILAADEFRGSQSNPHDVGSPAYLRWLDVYYARVQELSVECAA